MRNTPHFINTTSPFSKHHAMPLKGCVVEENHTICGRGHRAPKIHDTTFALATNGMQKHFLCRSLFSFSWTNKGRHHYHSEHPIRIDCRRQSQLSRASNLLQMAPFPQNSRQSSHGDSLIASDAARTPTLRVL